MQKDARKSTGKMLAYLCLLVVMLAVIAGCIKVVWSRINGDSSATTTGLCDNEQAQQQLESAGLGDYIKRDCR